MPNPKLVPSIVLGVGLAVSGPAQAADPMEDCFSRDLEGEEVTACRDAASDAAYQARLSQSLFDTGQPTHSRTPGRHTPIRG